MNEIAEQSKYIYGGSTDIGYGRKVNEDYFAFRELGEDAVLAVIADGMGSKPSDLQPAAIAAIEAMRTASFVYGDNPELLLENPREILKEAMRDANRVIGAFRTANEEQYAGFGASMTCCLLYHGNQFAFAHIGNTRLSIIRILEDGSNKIIQLTEEHTEAMHLFEDGVINADDRYTHPARFQLTSCLGYEMEPRIQTYNGQLKVGDIILLTTDGVHYGIRPEYMAQIVLQGADWRGASLSLLEAAKTEQVPDNGTASLLYVINENKTK